ncbi:hypothetical protein DNF23_50270 [Pseudomonas syringae pv. pisi]
MRRRRGRHDAGERRWSRAAARAADPGGVRTWSPRRTGAGRCSSWPTRCGLAIAHPSSRTSTRYGAGAAGMLLASGADHAL